MTGPSRRRNILVVLPNHFASRNILKSDLPGILGERSDLCVTFASLYPEDEQTVRAYGKKNLSWRLLKYPVGRGALFRLKTAAFLFRNLIYHAVHILLLKRASHAALVFRFNQINGFFGHRLRRSMAGWFSTPGRRLKIIKGKPGARFNAQRYADPKLGWPFPNSRRLYEILSRLHYWDWGCNLRVESFFDQYRFDLVVINFIQTSRIFPYLTAARRRKIPVIGMVGSWDNPTLKGPVSPGLARYIVQNRYMAEKLSRHHGVRNEDIEITGWPQMDLYKKAGIIKQRTAFLPSMGIKADHRLLLFGANTGRLGAHEPGILHHMLKSMRAGGYGERVYLVIRSHPGDKAWRERFGGFIGKDDILVEPPDYHDNIHLANLLKHADIVITTAGTIALDAVAFDTCTINIAFDGDLQIPDRESVRMFYKLEHYASVVETGGTRLVKSFAELDQAIVQYLQHPDADAGARRALRDYHLEPFDGRAARRLAGILLQSL